MIEKIPNDVIEAGKIANLATRPNSKGLYGTDAMKPRDLKEYMDRLSLAAINKLNELIEYMESEGFADDISLAFDGEETTLKEFVELLYKELGNGDFAARIKLSDAESLLTALDGIKTAIKDNEDNIFLNAAKIEALNEAVEHLQPLFELRASEQERQENEEQRQIAEIARVEAYTKNEELVGVYTTKVDSLEKRVKNFENVSGGYIYDEIVDSSNAYAKTISAKVLPTGFVNRLGGLSRSSDNIMPYNDFTLGFCEKVSENTCYRGGITFRHNGDGTITLTGTSQDIGGGRNNALGLYRDNLVIPKGRYVIGVDVDGEDNIGVIFVVGYKDSSSSSYAYKCIRPNGGVECNISTDMPYVNIQIQIGRTYIGNTIAEEGLTLKPYILRLDDREGEIKEPYHFTPYYDGYKHAKVTSIISADENGESIDEYTIPQEIQGLDGYGLGISKDICNYIDFEAKTYTQMVALDEHGVPYKLDIPVISDISVYLPAQRCALKIADGGTVTFVNEDEARAVSELTYLEVIYR